MGRNRITEETENGWQARKIKVQVVVDPKHPNAWRDKDGFVMGTLTVYQGIDSQWWRLRHDPSNIQFGTYTTEEDAKRVGEVFNDRCQAALIQRGLDKLPEDERAAKIREKCPAWVLAWHAKCMTSWRFIPIPEDE
jgi:hypothetical protein